MTTVLLNLHNAGFYELNSMILAMGICYGGAAQIIAGIMEWKKGNTFATTAFISYGFFWWSLVALIVLPKLGWAGASNDTAMAAYLAMWGLFTGVMFIGTLRLCKLFSQLSQYYSFSSPSVISPRQVPDSNILPATKESSVDSLQFMPVSPRCSMSFSAKLCYPSGK